MSATGRGAERHELDYYETPLWATRAVLPHLGRPRRVVDLGCGGGAIGHALRLAWGSDLEIVGVEVDRGRVDEAAAATTGDGVRIYDLVLERDVIASLHGSDTKVGDFDLAISNPPYTYAREFIDAARAFMRPGGKIAFLLRIGFAASLERFEWHQKNPSDVHVLSRRPGFYPNDPNKKDSAEYGWFLYGLGHGGHFSILQCEPSPRARRSA